MIILRAPARGGKGSRVGGGNDPWRVISDRFGPRPHDGADHSRFSFSRTRMKQRTLMAFREQGPCPVNPVCCIREHR